MLVSNIEQMEPYQGFSSPARVRLYRVDDVVPDGLAWATARFYMSVDGTFKRSAIALGVNWKIHPIADFATVGFDEKTVCVIKGGPEVVQGIAENGGCMSCEYATNIAQAFCPVDIVRGEQSIFACPPNPAKYPFKLLDMLFGPFSF